LMSAWASGRLTMSDKEDSGSISQDDIDSLLAEVEEGSVADSGDAADSGGDSGTDQGAADAAPKEPEVDMAAWGLDEEMNPLAEKVPEKPLVKAPGNKQMPELPKGAEGLEFLLDIPLRLSVEVGRTVMNIGELLTLGPGSIVELDKMAGEPLEIYINQKLVARGEAVIVNEKFGIRLTEVVSKTERIENLRE